MRVDLAVPMWTSAAASPTTQLLHPSQGRDSPYPFEAARVRHLLLRSTTMRHHSVVLSSTLLKGDEIEYYMEDSDAAAMVSWEQLHRQFTQAR